MGNMLDVWILNHKNYQLMHRKVNQGPIVLEISPKSHENLLVLIQNAENKQEIKKPMKSDFLAEHESLLAQLPLTEGYKASFSSLNIERLAITQQFIEVINQEKLSLNNKEHSACKVKLTESNGSNPQILWFSDGVLLNEEAILSQLDGALMKMELQEM
jgi:hypothetical protein